MSTAAPCRQRRHVDSGAAEVGGLVTLAQTDLELIEYFDNFAFDEVLRYRDVDTRARLVVQRASLIACQAVSDHRVRLSAALTVGVTPSR
jgi:4-carboxymuconolactone decarboxylase